MIKRGANFDLPVKFSGLDMSTVSSIQFIFKRLPEESAPALVTKTVSNPRSNPVNVTLSASDTYDIPAGIVYMDAKITLSSGKTPFSKIVPVDVLKTLFPET